MWSRKSALLVFLSQRQSTVAYQEWCQNQMFFGWALWLISLAEGFLEALISVIPLRQVASDISGADRMRATHACTVQYTLTMIDVGLC